MCVCFCVLGITASTLFNMFQTDRKGEKKKQTHRNKERGSKKVKEGYSYLKDRSKEIEERDGGSEGEMDLSFNVVRGDGMSMKQVNSDAEWLMVVVGKGKVKLSLLTQPLPILIASFILCTALFSYSNRFPFPLLITNILFIFH